MSNRDNLINNKLKELSTSKFRSSFHLRKYMIDYINQKGMDTIKKHTIDFIEQKLADQNPINDGRQTPMKAHPTFIAQHACACCCRGCIENKIKSIGRSISNDYGSHLS